MAFKKNRPAPPPKLKVKQVKKTAKVPSMKKAPKLKGSKKVYKPPAVKTLAREIKEHLEAKTKGAKGAKPKEKVKELGKKKKVGFPASHRKIVKSDAAKVKKRPPYTPPAPEPREPYVEPGPAEPNGIPSSVLGTPVYHSLYTKSRGSGPLIF
jgi:hypothetical protein